MTEQTEIINYIKKNPINMKEVNTTNTTMIQETKSESVIPQHPEPIKNTNRCYFDECNKKLTLVETLGKCKCGNVYCTKHRHSTNHKCTYDYKQDNNHIIYKAEPKKLNKI